MAGALCLGFCCSDACLNAKVATNVGREDGMSVCGSTGFLCFGAQSVGFAPVGALGLKQIVVSLVRGISLFVLGAFGQQISGLVLDGLPFRRLVAKLGAERGALVYREAHEPLGRQAFLALGLQLVLPKWAVVPLAKQSRQIQVVCARGFRQSYWTSGDIQAAFPTDTYGPRGIPSSLMTVSGASRSMAHRDFQT